MLFWDCLWLGTNVWSDRKLTLLWSLNNSHNLVNVCNDNQMEGRWVLQHGMLWLYMQASIIGNFRSMRNFLALFCFSRLIPWNLPPPWLIWVLQSHLSSLSNLVKYKNQTLDWSGLHSGLLNFPGEFSLFCSQKTIIGSKPQTASLHLMLNQKMILIRSFWVVELGFVSLTRIIRRLVMANRPKSPQLVRGVYIEDETMLTAKLQLRRSLIVRSRWHEAPRQGLGWATEEPNCSSVGGRWLQVDRGRSIFGPWRPIWKP